MIPTLVIGISGSSASGKSFVTKMIGEKFGESIVSISMDNFYKGLNENENVTEYNFDEPSALDMEMFTKCINDIKLGKNILIPIYDIAEHKRTGYTEIQPKKIVIVEGIFIFTTEELRKLFDIKVFIDANISTVIFRRLERDMVERGRDLVSIKNQYNKFVYPSYKKYIKPMKKLCDLVIPNEDNSNFIGIQMLFEVINSKLKC